MIKGRWPMATVRGLSARNLSIVAMIAALTVSLGRQAADDRRTTEAQILARSSFVVGRSSYER
jgi:hypothetical protein